jgi:hypothetical protein
MQLAIGFLDLLICNLPFVEIVLGVGAVPVPPGLLV